MDAGSKQVNLKAEIQGRLQLGKPKFRKMVVMVVRESSGQIIRPDIIRSTVIYSTKLNITGNAIIPEGQRKITKDPGLRPTLMINVSDSRNIIA